MHELIGVFFSVDLKKKPFIGKSVIFLLYWRELWFLEGPKTHLDQFSHEFCDNIPRKMHSLYGK